MSEPILRVSGLQKWFHGKPVLKGIDLEVSKGEVVSLIGPSGSGKSTLLRCLNQLEAIDAGEMWLEDERLALYEKKGKLHRLPEERVVKQRRHFGMVFQHFNLFPHMTVMENIIEAPTRVSGVQRSEAMSEAVRLLDLVGLRSHVDYYPAELSGGQQQRVAIARALAMKPKVMLFDEPTSALDPELVGEVTSVIRSLAESGMTMVVVTHEMSLCKEISDTIVVMEDGQVVETGTPKLVFSDKALARTQRFVARIA